MCLKENISKPFGCFCIQFDGYVKNETRLKYLKAAKSHGFQTAEIISIGRSELINMILNISDHENGTEEQHNVLNIFKRLPFISKFIQKGDKTSELYMILHVIESWVTCSIWQKTTNGFFFLHADQEHTNFDNTKIISMDDLEVLKHRVEEQYTITKLAVFDFYHCFTKNAIKTVFPNFEDINYCQEKPWSSSTLLYACHLSGAPEYSKYKMKEALEKRVTVKINNVAVITVAKFTSLPFSTETLLTSAEFLPFTTMIFYLYDFDELIEGCILEAPPDNLKIALEIDSNTISYFKVMSTDGKIIKTIEQNVNELYFRIPGRAFYFQPDLMAIGIDFGTVRCSAAVNRKNRIEIAVLDNNGSRMLPTFVTFDETFEKCGQLAIDRMRQNSKYTVFDIKRILGNSFDEINIDPMWSFKVLNINNEVFIEVETVDGRKTYKPVEIASMFFKHIKIEVEKFQGKHLTEAVITIPAFYNDHQKAAITSAAKLAGWKIIYLLPEPIAAAFAYCDAAALEINLNLLIFDLGGGTLDIFIVKTATCMLNVLSSNGSLVLGGRDFDTVLINYFDNALKEIYGIDVMENDSKKYKFLAVCQSIKCDLSYQNEAWLEVENYDSENTNSIQITREKFEQLSSHLLQKIEQITQEAVDKAKMKNEQIDVVLYAGGGCRMPMIKQFLTQMFFEAKHCCTPNPDEMVAEGAALYACFLKCKYP